MDEDRKFRTEWENYRKRKTREAACCQKDLPKRILVVKLADIGDLLTATPSLRALRETFPSAHISALVTPASAEALDGVPWVDDVIEFDSALFDIPRRAVMPRRLALAIRTAASLRRPQFDTVIVLHHLLTWWGAMKYALLTLRTGAKVRVGLDDGRGWFYTHKVLDGGFGCLHEVDYWLSTVGAIGARTHLPRLEVHVSREDDLAAEALFGERERGPIVAVHPGSGTYSLARRWPIERFAYVADRLVEEHRARILILGGTAEVELARQMESLMQRPVINLVGKTSLKQLAAVLRRCALYVGNDSGVMHVAVAAGTFVLAVFGPTNHRAWGPYTPDLQAVNGKDELIDRGVIIRSTRACSPCLYRNPFGSGSRPCDEAHCMKDIPSEAVLEVASRLLDSAQRVRLAGSLVG